MSQTRAQEREAAGLDPYGCKDTPEHTWLPVHLIEWPDENAMVYFVCPRCMSYTRALCRDIGYALSEDDNPGAWIPS